MLPVGMVIRQVHEGAGEIVSAVEQTGVMTLINVSAGGMGQSRGRPRSGDWPATRPRPRRPIHHAHALWASRLRQRAWFYSATELFFGSLNQLTPDVHDSSF